MRCFQHTFIQMHEEKMASSDLWLLTKCGKKANSQHWSFRTTNLQTRLKKKCSFQHLTLKYLAAQDCKKGRFYQKRCHFRVIGYGSTCDVFSFDERTSLNARTSRKSQNNWLWKNICKGSNFLYEFNKNNKYLISLFIYWFIWNKHSRSVGKN